MTTKPQPALLALALLLPAGCMQEMAQQPRYRPLQPSTLFDDGRSARPLVAGTVAHAFDGDADTYIRADRHFYEGLKTVAPKDAGLHTGLGLALEAKGETREALICYRAAIALDSQFAPVYCRLAMALARKQEPEKLLKRALAPVRRRYDVILFDCPPGLTVISLNGLAAATAYLHALETGGLALDDARAAIFFRLAVDADQFLSIAKLRALRLLWGRIEEACGLTPKPVFVSATTAWRWPGR